jgi:hypothetical protein
MRCTSFGLVGLAEADSLRDPLEWVLQSREKIH